MRDIYEILRRLPHRYPFLLVDRIIETDEDQKLVAIKNVSMNEPQFTGHFPELPIMPGVLIIEAMAQSCALLAHIRMKERAENRLFYFAAIEKARFKRVVIPGDQLRMECTFIREKANVIKMHCDATVDGQLACCADMTCSYQLTPNK